MSVLIQVFASQLANETWDLVKNGDIVIKKAKRRRAVAAAGGDINGAAGGGSGKT